MLSQDLHYQPGSDLATVSEEPQSVDQTQHEVQDQPGHQEGEGVHLEQQVQGIQEQESDEEINFDYMKIDIPRQIASHIEASQLLHRAYEIEQDALIFKEWADKQLCSATANVVHTAKQVKAAERQVELTVQAIEQSGYEAVVDWRRARREVAIPYVVDVDEGVYRISINGTDPLAVLIHQTYND